MIVTVKLMACVIVLYSKFIFTTVVFDGSVAVATVVEVDGTDMT